MADGVAGWLRSRARAWRGGSVRAQWLVAGVLIALIGVSFVISMINRDLMPLTAYFLWLLIARVLLSFRPLVVVAAVDVVAGSASLILQETLSPLYWVVITEFALCAAVVLYIARRAHSDLPSPLSEALLVELKERLQSQGRIPPLPPGWTSQSAMLASHGANYAGDFLVADLREGRELEVILVDVCGQGTSAGPAALQFSGALGGLIGALPPEQLFRAANDFLLRQTNDEAFATAVHFLIDLENGRYRITSAGHPPALRWDGARGEWEIDNARGTALGVMSEPELHSTDGVLAPGGALLFYTDGVVEGRTGHLDDGIAWLRRTAGEAIASGFDGAARRIVARVESGEDDRAVLILNRATDTDPAGARGVRAVEALD